MATMQLKNYRYGEGRQENGGVAAEHYCDI